MSLKALLQLSSAGTISPPRRPAPQLTSNLSLRLKMIVACHQMHQVALLPLLESRSITADLSDHVISSTLSAEYGRPQSILRLVGLAWILTCSIIEQTGQSGGAERLLHCRALVIVAELSDCYIEDRFLLDKATDPVTAP